MSEQQRVLGTGVFATLRGLTVHGTGALADLAGYPQAVELRGRGGDERALPHAGEEVLFRRVVRYQDGGLEESGSGRLDLLGIAGPRRDASWRQGYMGACAAVAHRQLEAYGAALAEARRLSGQVDELLNEANAARWRREPGERRPGPRRRFGLDERDAGKELWLYSQVPDGEAAWSLEAFRQLVWLDGYALSSMLAFQHPRTASTAIDAELFGRCREAKQQEIEQIESGFRAEFERRLAEIEHEYRAAATAPQPGSGPGCGS